MKDSLKATSNTMYTLAPRSHHFSQRERAKSFGALENKIRVITLNKIF